MIVAISIVDKHKKKGSSHVGTIQFEIPGVDASASHYDLLAAVCPHENEHLARPMLGRLMSKADLEANGGARRIVKGGGKCGQ